MGIDERLVERQATFTKTERRVAAWLEGHGELVAFNTVNAIAICSLNAVTSRND